MSVVVIVCILCTVAALLFWAVCIDSARRERVQRHAFERWLATKRKETGMDELDDLGRREVELQRLIAAEERLLADTEREVAHYKAALAMVEKQLVEVQRERDRLERPDVWPA